MTDALESYLPPECGVEGCTELGPFATDDGARCFMHANFAPLPEGSAAKFAETFHPTMRESGPDDRLYPTLDQVREVVDLGGKPSKRKRKAQAPADDLNDTSARALAALVLQATADALTTDPKMMEMAILRLAADLPAPLEVSAGILFATTALAGTAGLVDQEVFAIGEAFESQAEQESQQPTDGDGPVATDEPTERGDDEGQSDDQ